MLSKRQHNRIIIALLTACLILPWGCSEQTLSGVIQQEQTKVIAPKSYRELQQFFTSINYDVDTLHSGVPRLILTHMPKDMERLRVIPEKKRLFFLSLLPMTLIANEEILLQRERLIALLARHHEGTLLSEEDSQWLSDLTRQYGLTGDPLTEDILCDRLLERVDVIPPSLVLAQAANESAWGTSRFAKLANNLFGEWTFTPGTGIVPKGRPAGATYEVRKFGDIYQSLRSYIHNLNTHRSYRTMRTIRAQMRERGLEPRGLDMAAGLEKYSIRRGAYVKEIQAMIHQNELTALSRMNLKVAENVP